MMICCCAVQGWLDITYLSPDGSFRLSRGNKGTLFILTRDVPLQEQLLEAVASRSSNEQVHVTSFHAGCLWPAANLHARQSAHAP